MNIRIRGYDDATAENAETIAREMANDNAMAPLGAGYAIRYVGADDMVTRAWVLIGAGQTCELSASEPMTGLGPLIATFKPGSEAEDEAFAALCIAEAGKPEVVAWLGFASDPF